MEMTLSANHQIHTLSLTSSNKCNLRSPSSFSLSNLKFVRTQFLGCAHNLRPPRSGPLRSRKKFNKLGLLYVQSSPFILKASLDSHSIFVIFITVTLSAVSLALFTQRTRKNNVKEITGRPKFALSPQGSNVGNQVLEGRILGFEFRKEDSLKESALLKGSSGEDNHAFEDKEAELPFLGSTLMQEEAVMTKTSESPSDVFAASICNASSSNISKVGNESLLAVALQSSSLQPLTFAEEITELQVGKTKDKVDSHFELPLIMDKSIHIAASASLNNELTAVNEHAEERSELGATSNHVLFGESARQELYMFYEVNKSTTGSMSPLVDLNSLSPQSSFMNRNELFSSMGTTTIKGLELSAEISQQSAESIEGVLPIASYKEGYPPQSGRKNLRGGIRDLSARERNHLDQKSNKVLSQITPLTEEHANQKSHRSEHIRKYNDFLKKGRLNKCVEFLEDMDRKGYLDMTKVYHAKFFNMCKRQKAVREAFDYVKLIPNPKLSTFNMLMTVCASSQDSEGAFHVLQLVQEAGQKPDCKLYTTLISTCAKSGKVDQMFEVFHEMVNSEVEPNVHTYGALIDGCAKAGQVAKAFGAYGMMRSKKVKPDRVVFNALIAACAQSGAVDRAFDVLTEMAAETQPIDPDHITVGSLLKACANAGQFERAREVYNMIHQYNIKGTPEVYTIAINSCSQTGDWEFACSVYRDMMGKGVCPDEMFISALIDVAGHAGNLDAAFEVIQEACNEGICVGIMSYSSLMGACSKARNWQKALQLYEDLKSLKLVQTVSVVNALITALCDGDQFPKAMEVLSEMKGLGICPNSITYSILIVASEKKEDLEAGEMLLSQAKMNDVTLNAIICRCIIGMCLRRFERASSVGEPVLSLDSGHPQINNKWTSLALMVYRETIGAGEMPTREILSQILGCFQIPNDASLKTKLIENLGVSTDTSKSSNLCSLIDGFGEYDSRVFALLEEAASLGIVPTVSFKVSPIVLDAKELHTFTAEVYLLTVLKGLKHRLAAGARLPNVIILLPTEKAKFSSQKGEKVIKVAGRVGQAVTALLRRLRIPYRGNESHGKIRISGVALKRWLQPKLGSPFGGKRGDLNLYQSRLGKIISHQQRNIRTSNLSLDQGYTN